MWKILVLIFFAASVASSSFIRGANKNGDETTSRSISDFFQELFDYFDDDSDEDEDSSEMNVNNGTIICNNCTVQTSGGMEKKTTKKTDKVPDDVTTVKPIRTTTEESVDPPEE